VSTWANLLRRVPHSVLWLLDWGGHAVPQVRTRSGLGLDWAIRVRVSCLDTSSTCPSSPARPSGDKRRPSQLRAEMAAHGVSGRRLVWGDVKAAAAHLRRAEAADLFLDTVAYNGHTSAADALWAGVPV
jgi:predicted O-linked N-acetylglucosamine transferase (SPINDLY family)